MKEKSSIRPKRMAHDCWIYNHGIFTKYFPNLMPTVCEIRGVSIVTFT